ncbi:Reverse transcriptase domain [Cinara cedri]|uniref:Reverse transcriptase domain n=1 Tax=Cinara cedri TaxID=506608 RepID=A0A5E4NC37_9HEMI|nr:Reverse transcriptase domain [Cinara cedri]
MTQDILDFIKERNIDYDKYKFLKNKITQKCRQAKEKWMEEYSEDIEIMMKRNNNGVYAKVKKLQYTPKTRSNIVKNKADRWKEYLEDLYIGEDINNREEEYIENEQNLNPAMRVIIALRQVPEKRIDVSKATFIAFVDLKKAFDKIDRKLLFNTLREAGINWKDRHLILNLYKGQTTEIDVNGSKRQAKIRQGVRQGCPLSPYLFNLFIELVIDEMKEHTTGISINGKQFHYIRFADDIALLADSVGEMSLMLHILETSLDKFKLKINSKKTKVMVISKVITNTNITLNNEQLQQVNEFCYLGSLITDVNKSMEEIRRRIKSSDEWVFPLTKISRGQHLTDMYSYNNKAWPLEADDE